MIPDEHTYLIWQYCKDPNEIQKAVDTNDSNWKGLESLHQIISITFNTRANCYVVFWLADLEVEHE